MSVGKTTKEIFEEKLKEKKRIPLYNPEAIEKIKEGFDEWKNTKVREKERENWEVTPHTILGSEIPRGMLYTPCDVADLDYEADVGFPGQEPFTRGPYPNMYRGRVFTIRQLSGAGSPEETNERLKFLLESGATGTNLALDLPTVQMFDSDEPESIGQVGTVGVPIDCVQDMEVIYKDIPIDKVSSSIVTHYPRNSMIIFPMFLVMAEKRATIGRRFLAAYRTTSRWRISFAELQSTYLLRTTSGYSATTSSSSGKRCRDGIISH